MAKSAAQLLYGPVLVVSTTNPYKTIFCLGRISGGCGTGAGDERGVQPVQPGRRHHQRPGDGRQDLQPGGHGQVSRFCTLQYSTVVTGTGV